MVEKELITTIGKVALDGEHAAVEQAEREVKAAASESHQDPSEQTAKEMERITEAALRTGGRILITAVKKAWGSSAKAKDITEDIDI